MPLQPPAAVVPFARPLAEETVADWRIAEAAAPDSRPAGVAEADWRTAGVVAVRAPPAEALPD
jgi:hypothetical protein